MSSTSLPSFSYHPAPPPPVRTRLTQLSEQPCSYLPGRMSTVRAVLATGIPGEVYQAFMDRGFRRSGSMLYQPTCRGCRACVPLRVPVDAFRPSKSQRRSVNRNADLAVTVGEAAPSDEKFALYRRYVTQWHGKPDDAGGADDGGRAAFESFLYDSPVETIEFQHRDAGGRLLAVGLCDVNAVSLSSVYFYFDPADAARGLGTFGAMREIAHAAAERIPYYYLGYWIADCREMKYKADYRPHELLHPDAKWRPAITTPAPPGAIREQT